MLTPQGRSTGSKHRQHAGEPVATEQHQTQLTPFDAECGLARIERESLSEADELVPHGRDVDSVARLRVALSAHPSVQGAWLVRKRVAHCPEDPLYLLFVQFHGPSLVSVEQLQQLSEQLPRDVCAWLIPSDCVGAMLARAQAIEGALVWRRN